LITLIGIGANKGAEMCACLAAAHHLAFGRERCAMSKLRPKAIGSSSNEISTPGLPHHTTAADEALRFRLAHCAEKEGDRHN
jgi:hypothetical protein